MSAFLYRLGRASARHPFRVLGLWLVAAIAVMALQSSAAARSGSSRSANVAASTSQHTAAAACRSDVGSTRFRNRRNPSAQ